MKQKMTNFNNKNKRANTEPRAISPQKCTIYKWSSSPSPRSSASHSSRLCGSPAAGALSAWSRSRKETAWAFCRGRGARQQGLGPWGRRGRRRPFATRTAPVDQSPSCTWSWSWSCSPSWRGSAFWLSWRRMSCPRMRRSSATCCWLVGLLRVGLWLLELRWWLGAGVSLTFGGWVRILLRPRNRWWLTALFGIRFSRIWEWMRWTRTRLK